MTIEDVEKELKDACADLAWRNKKDALDRLLSVLSWWLDVKGEHPAALTVSAFRNEVDIETQAASVLEGILAETDSISVEDLLATWKKMMKVI